MPRKNIISWDTVPIIMDLPMAAQILGVNAQYLKTLSQKGRFPAYKVNERAWRVNRDDLKAWTHNSALMIRFPNLKLGKSVTSISRRLPNDQRRSESRH